MNQETSKWITIFAMVTLALGVVLAAANSISIPKVEFGAGVSNRPNCLADAVVDFETSLQGTLTGVSVTPIGADCANQWVRLSIFSSSDGSGTPLEQIVWQIPGQLAQGTSSFTARADGSTTGVVGSTVWPASETGGAGRAATAITVSAVNSFTLETSNSSISDGP